MKTLTLPLAIILLSCGCTQEPVKLDENPQQKIEAPQTQALPVYLYRKDVLHGMATIISDKDGQYIITARHCFDKLENYSVSSPNFEKKQIVAVMGSEDSDLIVGLLGNIKTSIGPLSSTFGNNFIREIEKGVNLIIIRKPRTLLCTGTNVTAIVSATFQGQSVECLNCYLKPGSSGAGIVTSATNDGNYFWIVSGAWPAFVNGAIQEIEGIKETEGFTLTCGTSTEEIQKILRELLAKQKK